MIDNEPNADSAQQQDDFERYFQENIEPLVDEDNMIKRRYHGRFWAFFWSVGFFICMNALIALFNTLMHGKPFNYQLLCLVSLCAFSIVFFPIFSYYRHKRTDIFDIFLRYYGDWKHGQHKEVQLVHSPVIPAHDFVSSSHDISSSYQGVDIEVRDTIYTKKIGPSNWNWRRKVSGGVILYLTFPEKFKQTILMFEKNGFMRKNKFNNMQSRTAIIDVPVANYFNIFCSDDEYIRRLLRSSFFESLLDMKDALKAKHVYVEINENYMRVYFENSTLYIDNYKFWSKTLNKEKFRQLNSVLESIFAYIEVFNFLLRNF